jgi:ComF family protein
MCAVCSRGLPLVDDFRHPAAHFCPECRERLEFLPKTVCGLCGRPFYYDPPASPDSPHTLNPERLCGDCLREPPVYHSARSALAYAGTAAGCLSRLKYHGDRSQVKILAALCGERLTAPLAAGALPDIIIPIPLSERRQFERGYNQALELAVAIYRPWRRLIDDRVLVRLAGVDLPQAALSGKARHTAIRGCFQAVDSAKLRGATVLLFDDVLTTGATVSEAARVLRAAGAARVDVVTIARAVLGAWR